MRNWPRCLTQTANIVRTGFVRRPMIGSNRQFKYDGLGSPAAIGPERSPSLHRPAHQNTDKVIRLGKARGPRTIRADVTWPEIACPWRVFFVELETMCQAGYGKRRNLHTPRRTHFKALGCISSGKDFKHCSFATVNVPSRNVTNSFKSRKKHILNMKKIPPSLARIASHRQAKKFSQIGLGGTKQQPAPQRGQIFWASAATTVTNLFQHRYCLAVAQEKFR